MLQLSLYSSWLTHWPSLIFSREEDRAFLLVFFNHCKTNNEFVLLWFSQENVGKEKKRNIYIFFNFLEPKKTTFFIVPTFSQQPNRTLDKRTSSHLPKSVDGSFNQKANKNHDSNDGCNCPGWSLRQRPSHLHQPLLFFSSNPDKNSTSQVGKKTLRGKGRKMKESWASEKWGTGIVLKRNMTSIILMSAHVASLPFHFICMDLSWKLQHQIFIILVDFLSSDWIVGKNYIHCTHDTPIKCIGVAAECWSHLLEFTWGAYNLVTTYWYGIPPDFHFLIFFEIFNLRFSGISYENNSFHALQLLLTRNRVPKTEFLCPRWKHLPTKNTFHHSNHNYFQISILDF